MLTRVKRKISKQLSHENISEQANSPEESPGRKHSTAERKHSTAERKLSKAERKRSTAEKRHARSKSLESSTDPSPEVQYLMYEIQGLQAEVNALKGQLEEETKRSQELKNLKTQQVCALTFKLASAIRQREIAEENAEKAKAELEELQSKVNSCNSCLRVMAPSEKQEVLDKLRKISEESDSSVEVDDENEKEDHHVSDSGDSAENFNANVRRSNRKSGVAITPDDLEKLIEGQGRGPNESGYHSLSGEDISGDRAICNVETQTLPPEDERTVVDQETQCDSPQESSSPRQMDQDILSQEFCRIQEELGAVRGNMSMVQALNQRLSEDLQTFTKNYEQLQSHKEEGNDENKSSENQSSVAVSFRSSLSHAGSSKVDHRIGEPQVEAQTCTEKPVTLQIAGENYAGCETLEKFDDQKVCLNKVELTQEVKETQVVKLEGVRDSAVGTDLQHSGKKHNAGINDEDLVGFMTDMESPETATAEQMKLVKEQLQIAMMEIDQLRSDNNEMKRELRKISENAGNELLVKTTRYTDQLLREMKQREASTRSRVSSCSSDANRKYPFALVDNFDRETDDVFLPEKITPTQCPQLKEQPGMPHFVRGSEQRSMPSLPLRRLGNRLQEMTETLDDMTEQAPLRRCPQDSPVPDHFSHPVAPCFAPKYEYQRRALETAEPILGTKEGAFGTPTKLGERGIHSSSGALIAEKVKVGGLLDEERSKPLDFSRAIKNSYTLRDSRKPFSAPYANDYIQRHIVRSSDYIAKLRDLRPEELDRPQEN